MVATENPTTMGGAQILAIITQECRDLLDRQFIRTLMSAAEKNEAVRKHLAGTDDPYNIAVEEYLPGVMSAEERERIVNDILAGPEYEAI